MGVCRIISGISVRGVLFPYFLKIEYSMKRPTRAADGHYHIHGHKYKMCIGSRQQVWHGTAYKTPGCLTKKALMMNKWGRIVSAKKHATAKKEKRLEKHGYFATKGKFGFTKKEVKKHRRKSSKK